jgi:thiol-disulfide isomerase/thioredoxin
MVMRRFLSVPLVWACVFSAGCDDDAAKPPPSAPRDRSQAVVATDSAPAPAPATPAAHQAATPAAPSGAAHEPRRLCETRQGKARRKVSAAGSIDRAQASGESTVPARLLGSKAEVTWVNFWAAWCVPCREEIPRLVAWEKKLQDEGVPFRLVFVSLDDDERQLRDFLEKQPTAGLRRTYWLREGSQREEWLANVGMDTDPRLPAHLVVAASGETHCVVEGAVEDGDFEQVRRVVKSAAH